MCQRLKMQIKSVSDFGQKGAYIPCGKCPSCRSLIVDSWATRLACEVMAASKQGYYAVFCTLTFDENKCPRIPNELLKDEYRHFATSEPLAFNKEIGRSFIKKLRDWLLRSYDVHRPIYLFTSEFGSSTQRPHHHMLICVPNKVDSHVLFDKINELWRDNGFVFPRYHDGGMDSHGYRHKSFVVQNLLKSVMYTAKYCAKDLAYLKYLDLRLYEKEREGYKLSDYLPYHLQTRSLGVGYIANLSVKDKLKILEHGIQFVGDTFCHALPIYFRRKIIYDNYYIVDEKGKRLCRTRANAFFAQNLEEIYRIKIQEIGQRFDKWRNRDYWISIGLTSDSSLLDDITDTLRLGFFNPKDYLLYFGVPWSHSFESNLNLSESQIWGLRYDCGVCDYDYLSKFSCCIDFNFHWELNRFFVTLHQTENELLSSLDMVRQEQINKTDKVRDFVKSRC